MYVQAPPDGLSEEQLVAIDAKYKVLFEARSARNAQPEGLATAEDIGALALDAARPVHSTTSPGILAVALAPEGSLVATGAVCLMIWSSSPESEFEL